MVFKEPWTVLFVGICQLNETKHCFGKVDGGMTESTPTPPAEDFGTMFLAQSSPYGRQWQGPRWWGGQGAAHLWTDRGGALGKVGGD